jgi:type II secretory pathway component PulF
MNQALGPFSLILLLIPAVALRIAVRALYGPRRLTPADPMQLVLSLSSTIMFVLAGLGFLVGLIGQWYLLIPLAIGLIVIVFMVIDRTRHAEHRGLIWALAAAAQRGVPLAEAARAYADETLGDTGRRALSLAEALERGEPLSTAIRSARLRVSPAMSLAVRMGERLGLLGQAMRQQIDDSQQIDLALRDLIGRFFYLATVLLVMIGACSFVMLKIVPEFQKMFEEFGLKLPAMTQFVIRLASNTQLLLLVTFSFGAVVVCGSSGILIASIQSLLQRLWPIHPGKNSLLNFVQRFVRTCLATALFLLLAAFWWPIVLVGPFILYYVGWFPRNLPIIWRLFKRYDGALVMRALALAVRRQIPLPQALHLVAESFPLSIVAGRLREAASRVEGGMDWCQSLEQTGLIGQADAAVLAAAQRTGNLDWALEEMADSALRREVYRLQVLLQILFPMVLLAIGMFEFLFVVGLFLPLISLIQGLT